MLKFDTLAFSKAIKQKRLIDEDITIHNCSSIIGVSSATLSRLENESVPDMETFVKVLNWLKHKANKYIK